jgi:hypothetical protein
MRVSDTCSPLFSSASPSPFVRPTPTLSLVPHGRHPRIEWPLPRHRGCPSRDSTLVITPAPRAEGDESEAIGHASPGDVRESKQHDVRSRCRARSLGTPFAIQGTTDVCFGVRASSSRPPFAIQGPSDPFHGAKDVCLGCHASRAPRENRSNTMCVPDVGPVPPAFGIQESSSPLRFHSAESGCLGTFL